MPEGSRQATGGSTQLPASSGQEAGGSGQLADSGWQTTAGRRQQAADETVNVTVIAHGHGHENGKDHQADGGWQPATRRGK